MFLKNFGEKNCFMQKRWRNYRTWRYSGSGSCYFRHWPSRCQQKTNLSNTVFLLITFWRYIYIVFKDKKSKRSHKVVGIKVFLLVSLGDRRSGSIPPTNGSGSRRPKNIRIRIRNTGEKSIKYGMNGSVYQTWALTGSGFSFSVTSKSKTGEVLYTA